MATWTNATLNSSTFTNQDIVSIATWGDLYATWGDAIEVWGSGGSVWTNGTKDSTSFTNQTKN